MTNWGKVVGALCIVLSMVLGAAAGFVYAKPGDVGVSLSAGTRAEKPKMMYLDDDGQMKEIPVDDLGRPLITDAELDAIRTKDRAADLTENANTAEVVTEKSRPFEFTEDGVSSYAEIVTPQELNAAAKQGGAPMASFESLQGRIEARVEGTRDGTLPPGMIDAGGPYGGPDFFEGTATITFTVTPLDPSIIFYRWDFNNDGVFDFPSQLGVSQTCPPCGAWTTMTSYTKTFFDNYFGDIVVQGWDGVSTFIQINTGNSFTQRTNWSGTWGLFGATYRQIGWRFTAKAPIVVTRLGHLHYVSYTVYDLIFYQLAAGTNARTRLGVCSPSHVLPPGVIQVWNWCTLPTPLTLVPGADYWMAIRIESTYINFIGAMAETPQIRYASAAQGCFIFGTDPNMCGPSDLFFTGPSNWFPTVDFEWRETLVLPDTTRDTARLQVQNVAPDAFGVGFDPNPGLEGSKTNLFAWFNDPGTDDTWEFRWTFADGTTSPWTGVTKLSGGAKVLYLHAQTDVITAVSGGLRTACGTYCVKLDFFDFGPLGLNRVPSLDELLPYDVVYVAGRWGAISSSDGMGNALADYMDAGGNVIIDHVANFASNTWGIGGRWQSDGYAPVPRGGEIFANTMLGPIFVPGHPILDGVSSWTAQYILNIVTLNPGATRVANWASGQIAIATNTNPKVNNGARSVYIDMVPFLGFDGGDFFRIMANAIRFASGKPDPTLKPMPIQLDLYPKVFRDDDPTTTTPIDTFPVRVEVRDDDDGKFVVFDQSELFFNNLNSPGECSWSTVAQIWPAGWSANPASGWRCENQPYSFDGSRSASILWFYNDPNYGTGNGVSDLFTGTYDLSGFSLGRLEFDTRWQGNGVPGPSDGYVDASTDGGATFPYRLREYHHLNPSVFIGHVTLDSWALGGSSNVVFRFQYVSNDDWGWSVDNVRVTGYNAEVIDGLDDASGEVTIANVPPTVVGGFASASRLEAQGLRFGGFKVSDPALLESTEWFAYRWDIGDGTPSTWTYKGSLAAPKFRVLAVHSWCGSGNACTMFNQHRDKLLALDDVASVTGYNLIQFPPAAPPLSLLLQYDLILYGTFTIYLDGTNLAWENARRNFGNNLALYLDAGRGGVVTEFLAYETGGNTEGGAIRGRYLTDDYGPFEIATYTPSGSTLGTIYDLEHEALADVRSGMVDVAAFHGGDYRPTIGGGGQAAGTNGLVLADWANGDSAIGVKTLLNGRRTAHIGGRFGDTFSGADLSKMLRNVIGWAAGGIPTPNIAPFTHAFGDNGVYSVDVQIIDDDMGYIWDPVAGAPRQVMPGPVVSHRMITVTVDNTDPVILTGQGGQPGIQAFLAAQLCVRVTGQVGNTVSVSVFQDGVLAASTSVTRMGGDPNPATEKCGLLKMDVRARHTYSAQITYTRPNGGSNPTWLIFSPWRDPVTPGHGTVTYKYDLATPGTTNVALPTLKRDLIDGGLGAKIDFAADAVDAGTDDLAFFWSWGGEADIAYMVGPLSVYTIHVFHNSGVARSDGTLASSQFLGFSEPYFDRAANTGLSALGTTNFVVHDTATHAFAGGQTIYWVFLAVLDDDNGRGYPSPFGLDGIDVEVFVIDLG